MLSVFTDFWESLAEVGDSSEWQDLIIGWFLSHGLTIVFVILGSFILNKIGVRFIARAVKIAVVPQQGDSPEAEEKREQTLSRIFGTTFSIVVVIMAALMVLQELGVEIAPLLAGAGIIGLAFGFGGQYLIRDVITGLFIILENQYRIGDVVNLGGTGGVVEDISLRMTTLRDMDGVVHHIPHGEITKVSNMTKSFSKVNLNIRVSYNTNLDHLIRVVNKVGEELALKPEFKDKILTPPSFLRVDSFGDSAINVKIVSETAPSQQWAVAGEYRKMLKEAFDREGIEIPFPQVVVHPPKGATNVFE